MSPKILAGVLLVTGCVGCSSLPPTARATFESRVRVPRVSSEDEWEEAIRSFLSARDDALDYAEVSAVVAGSEFPELDILAACQRVDEIAERVRPRLSSRDPAKRKVALLAEFIHDELGIRYNLENPPDGDNTYLHRIFETKLANCVGLTVLYLALGQRLGLPLYGVRAPIHVFVRYDDGKQRFNVETTQGGAIFTDTELADRLGATKQAIRSGAYMTSLRHREMVAAMLVNRVARMLAQRQFGLVIRDCTLAAEFSKTDPNVFNNRGAALAEEGDLERAEADLARALGLDPQAPGTLSNLGAVMALKGDFKQAHAFVDQALSIDPSHAEARKNKREFSRMGARRLMAAYDAAIVKLLRDRGLPEDKIQQYKDATKHLSFFTTHY